ncbi:MAG: SDR family oxidoreductase [Sphingobacteriales bacterium]|nr:SDR family oxidoreductase [Sphingobacteriales bacterium]MBI3719388.1 SDR family oxidoreductase [Sphingobacteriales bacterium]
MNVVITGASKGIGRAIAEIFAANGHNLYLCSRNEVALYKAMEELITKHPHIHVKAKARDLSTREGVDSFGDWILNNSINIDVLVNNAGLFEPGSVYNEPEGAIDRMMAVNFYSAYHLTRKLIHQMMEQSDYHGSRGHIFNICSTASLSAYKNGGAYSISKYALHGFSKNLREEMKSYKIKVTSVFPGAVYTDSWSGSDVDPKRIMESEDIAKLVYTASQLSPTACVEDILIRPQLGDL